MEDWQTRLNELMAKAHEQANAAQAAANAGKNLEAYDHITQVRRVAREAQDLLLEKFG